jgi:hypothetical protein
VLSGPRSIAIRSRAQYTPWKARIAGFVLLLLGIAGVVVILYDKGAAVDFFLFKILNIPAESLDATAQPIALG